MDRLGGLASAGLTAEVRCLAGEIVAAKRTMAASPSPDPALVARLAHCFDRLDEIGTLIGTMTVYRICDAVRDALAGLPEPVPQPSGAVWP
ncbi:MAG: hypothetical protein ACJ8F7_14070 [Gemmataceae bacterium]